MRCMVDIISTSVNRCRLLFFYRDTYIYIEEHDQSSASVKVLFRSLFQPIAIAKTVIRGFINCKVPKKNFVESYNTTTFLHHIIDTKTKENISDLSVCLGTLRMDRFDLVQLQSNLTLFSLEPTDNIRLLENLSNDCTHTSFYRTVKNRIDEIHRSLDAFFKVVAIHQVAKHIIASIRYESHPVYCNHGMIKACLMNKRIPRKVFENVVELCRKFRFHNNDCCFVSCCFYCRDYEIFWHWYFDLK